MRFIRSFAAPLGFLWVFTCLLFVGCSPASQHLSIEDWASAKDRIRVLSTTAMIDDLVGHIGGDRVVHLPLIVGEIDPHSYELVKGDDEKLKLAQLIFYNGLGLEHGASLRYYLTQHPNCVAVGNAVQNHVPDQVIYVGKEIDPHIWMDISLWSEVVDPIVDALSQLDPAFSEEYARNGQLLKNRMLELHEKVFQSLQAVPEQMRFLVTSHDAFNYFARAYLATAAERESGQWRVRFDAPEGLSPDGQLSTADIQQVIDYLIQYQIHTVFPESNVSRDSLKKIVSACAQKGLSVRIAQDPIYGDAMGPPGSGADTYLTMIEHDADVLIRAWE